MGRFAIRHWTGILLTIVVLWWALFYVPNSPSYAVYKMKEAIDARDGEAAARYVDFESVVRHAGYEMVSKNSNDPLSALVGKGTVDLFVKPMAQVAKSVAIKKVNDGADEVQMPPVAVVGAIVLMHRDDGTAYTRFRDKKGREWEVRMARDTNGVWQVSEVKDIQQLLEKLKREEQKRLNNP